LPVPYFHIVFTLPAALRAIAYAVEVAQPWPVLRNTWLYVAGSGRGRFAPRPPLNKATSHLARYPAFVIHTSPKIREQHHPTFVSSPFQNPRAGTAKICDLGAAVRSVS
jgi:hypothetical protein